MTAYARVPRKTSPMKQPNPIWYSSVIRPVLEYCAVVWHHGLRKYQTEATEAIERRAIPIIYPVTTSMRYWVALQYAELSSLSDRCGKLCRDFSANCSIHLTAFIICCHPVVTLKSPLGLEEQPHILHPVTVLTATNHSSRLPKIPIGPSLSFVFIALHCISCLVLFCCIV